MRSRRSMTAVLLACATLAAASLVWAQSERRDACVASCEQAEARCIDACDTHDNPVECEESCHDRADDCRLQCEQ